MPAGYAVAAGTWRSIGPPTAAADLHVRQGRTIVGGLSDSRNWNFDDPQPGVALECIEPKSIRATALLARSNSSVLHTDFIQVSGVISILSGLEYHHSQLMTFLARTTTSDFSRPDFGPARHEAVAWINRVGQFAAFAKSQLVVRWIGTAAMPNINFVVQFRNKHTAHRSIDSPRREDTENLKISQAMCLADVGGTMWHSREPANPNDTFPSHETHMIGFQMQSADGSHQDLVIEQRHDYVTTEAYKILEALLNATGSP